MAEYNNDTTRKWAQIVIPKYDKSQNVTLEQLHHATDAFIIENLTVVNECIQAINKNMTYELVKNKSGIIKLHNSYLQSVKPYASIEQTKTINMVARTSYDADNLVKEIVKRDRKIKRAKKQAIKQQKKARKAAEVDSFISDIEHLALLDCMWGD